MVRYQLLLFGSLFASCVNGAQDAVPAQDSNTFSVTLENLNSGEKSKITVSGPPASGQDLAKEITERLARDAVNNPKGVDSAWAGKFYFPNDYVQMRPANAPKPAAWANFPGFAGAPQSSPELSEENSKLKQIIELQKARIELLEQQIVTLQSKK